jgi:hypothetical protein
MKKLFALLIISLISYTANADQLAYISREQADKAVAYLKNNSITQVLIWCGCCEKDELVKVNIKKVYARHTGSSNFYEVVIEGTKENGQVFSSAVDLAYVFVRSGNLAKCLGVLLDFDCDPCTVPFDWPK